MCKRTILVALWILLLIFAQPEVTAARFQTTGVDYHPHRILVKFRVGSPQLLALKEAAARQLGQSILTINLPDHDQKLFSLLNSASVVELRALKYDVQLSPLPGGLERIFIFQLDPEAVADEAIRRLQESGEFEYVEHDYMGVGGGAPCEQEIPWPSAGAFIPNDPLFGNQWALRNAGQVVGGVAGKSGADIDATRAWDLSTGSDKVLLAVLDSGIPQNAAEFGSRVVPGYDYVNNDPDPTDDLGHGSNVTSIAAATGNNGMVMAGVNWKCKIIHFKILNSQNSGYYSWWASALYAAADSGARVISMSVGGTSASSTLHSAIQYAASKGAIITAAMMNANNEVTYYPAAYPEVIAVGAINNLDLRAVPFCYSSSSGSNYGSHIDFVAPGELILGLYYLDPTQGTYWCGTSQATPQVAGAITLMLGLKSDLTFQEVYDILKATARDQIGSPAEDVSGWDKFYGWGCIDAYTALQHVSALLAVASPATVPGSCELRQNYPNPFNPTTVIEYGIPVRTHVSLKVYNVMGQEIAVLVNEEETAGHKSVVFDATGLPSGVYLSRLTAGESVATRKLMLLK